MRKCCECESRALPESRWCAAHTPPGTFVPVSNGIKLFSLPPCSLCARCGREKEDHRQKRDGKPPHCPTAPIE